jgi:SM-20-related protein
MPHVGALNMSVDYFKPSLNPDIDIDLAQAGFAFQRRVQIGDIFTTDSAEAIYACLANETPWGFAWWDGDGPQTLCKPETDVLTPARAEHIIRNVQDRAKAGHFSFAFHCHPLSPSVKIQEKWMTPPLLDDLLAYLNSRELLELVREITNCNAICAADAHAAHFAPNQFLSLQQENELGQRRLAYTISLTKNWREDWGGYWQFYNAQGDIVQGYKPHFNSLSLCDVSQRRSISAVPSHAPYGHLAISGWFYDATS